MWFCVGFLFSLPNSALKQKSAFVFDKWVLLLWNSQLNQCACVWFSPQLYPVLFSWCFAEVNCSSEREEFPSPFPYLHPCKFLHWGIRWGLVPSSATYHFGFLGWFFFSFYSVTPDNKTLIWNKSWICHCRYPSSVFRSYSFKATCTRWLSSSDVCQVSSLGIMTESELFLCLHAWEWKDKGLFYTSIL